MILVLFGLAILGALVVGLYRGIPAAQQERWGPALFWILGLPFLVFFACVTIGMIMFMATDMNF